MEYGAASEDVARVCHAHPVSIEFLNIYLSSVKNKCIKNISFFFSLDLF